MKAKNESMMSIAENKLKAEKLVSSIKLNDGAYINLVWMDWFCFEHQISESTFQTDKSEETITNHKFQKYDIRGWLSELLINWIVKHSL